MGSQETPLVQLIRLRIGAAGGVRVFRNNVGTGWVGEVAAHDRDRIVLLNPRPLQAGLCKGSPDLVGWMTVTITPEMVGLRIAQFVGLEAKGPTARVRPEQQNFIDHMLAAGGRGGIVYSPEQAHVLLFGTTRSTPISKDNHLDDPSTDTDPERF
ncbi:MAG: VRR-NUC domain-containing protein [Elusimicrobia bacterium]|nr:VRR-NUC domain-containing protein [Elusimicrobiota bacterium]